jgi:NDP-sugar pyrophosphorylase family protein
MINLVIEIKAIKEMFQVVILAGGVGKRLMPMTENVPKSMTQINGKPFLEYLLKLLLKNNFKNVVLCIGYLGEPIRSYFSDGREFGLNIAYSEETELLGTGGAIKNAQNLLEEKFFVVYGDNYLPLQYHEMQEQFDRSNKIGLLSIYNNTEKRVPHNVYINNENQIKIYNKQKELPRMNGVEAGVSVFNKKLLEYIPDNVRISLEEKIYPKLIDNNELFGYLNDIKYYDIGTFERLKVFEEAYNDNLQDPVKN